MTTESQQYINSHSGKMLKKNKAFFQSRIELKLGDIVKKETLKGPHSREIKPHAKLIRILINYQNQVMVSTVLF